MPSSALFLMRPMRCCPVASRTRFVSLCPSFFEIRFFCGIKRLKFILLYDFIGSYDLWSFAVDITVISFFWDILLHGVLTENCEISEGELAVLLIWKFCAMSTDLWHFSASSTKAASGCVLCNNATWSTWDHKEVHEQASQDSGEERRADTGGYQAILCECWSGRVEVGHLVWSVWDIGYHPKCDLYQYPAQSGLADR